MNNTADRSLARLVPAHVMAFEAYIPSKPDHELKKLYGLDDKPLYRLNNNENPLGPPRAAREVLEGFESWRASVYPSGDAYDLRVKIATRFGLNPDQILVGNGANEVITFVIKAFCQEGDNIVTADKTFAVYEWVAQFSGYEARLVPLAGMEFDDQGMLEAIDERTKILFICNPNNPTGTYWSRERLLAFLDRVGGRQIVVVDEAYCEFVEDDDFPDGISLLDRYPNLVVFRTFSKMYGLAGLRVGYLAGSLEVVDLIRKTCVVYSVNTLAQEAAAVAIDDDSHVEATRRLVRQEKAYLRGELQRLGLSFHMAEGPYVMVKLPINDALAYRQLISRGVMVRTMTGFRFPNYIRVTVAPHEAMAAFIAALEAILEGI